MRIGSRSGSGFVSVVIDVEIATRRRLWSWCCLIVEGEETASTRHRDNRETGSADN